MSKRDKRKFERRVKELVSRLEGENAAQTITLLESLYTRPAEIGRGVTTSETREMVAEHLERFVQKSRDERARWHALRHLIGMCRSNTELLVRILERDVAGDMRTLAIDGLERQGWYEPTTLERLSRSDEEASVRATALKILRGGGWYDETILVELLGDTSADVQSTVLRMLVEHDRTHLERAVEELADVEGSLRRVALELIGEFGGPEHLPVLLDAAIPSEPATTARLWRCKDAVAAIAAVGGDDARRALSSLRTAHPEVARVAEEALAKMGGVDEDLPAAVRRDAIEANSHLPGDEAADSLRAALSDSDELVCKEAALGLRRLGVEPATPLEKAARWTLQGQPDDTPSLNDIGVTDYLLKTLGCWTWERSGLIAALLVEHGADPDDDRIRAVAGQLEYWAEKADDTYQDVEVGDQTVYSVERTESYESERALATQLLERIERGRR